MAKKKSPPPDPNDTEAFEAYRRRFIIAALRRGSLFWSYRNEALKLARVERGLYKCNKCLSTHPKSNVQLDHINPVVKMNGFTNWDSYFNSMFGKPSDFQVLCKPCHKLKTDEENIIRKIARKAKKSLV